MSKIEVNKIGPQCGTTLTVGCGAGQTVVADAATVTLGRCGGTVALASGATQTGFGRTGTVDWQTGSIKTATFTAANGEGYFCNTAGGAFELDLPAGSAGAIVSIQDYNNTFNSNALTVDPNGSEKINGGTAGDPLVLDTEGQGVTFVYIDSTVGWRSVQDNTFATAGSSFITATGGSITTSGNDKIHTFTGPGTFCVATVGACAANNLVSYMVIAGGGGSGSERGGGGGAGGYRETKSPVTPYTASPLDGYPTPGNRITVTATGFPITVGGGGGISGSYPPYSHGVRGSNSIFSTITATGGGGGKGALKNVNACAPGGSGGGGAHSTGCSGIKCGGTGNVPPVTPAQGTSGGGAGSPPGPSGGAAGGGGGAGGAGTQGSGEPGSGGAGGVGTTSSINGTPTIRAGGGAGGAWGGGVAPNNPGGGPAGGGVGGGPGGTGADCSTAGTANTGGGAGGAGPGAQGHSGGSGIVIIRYKFQ